MFCFKKLLKEKKIVKKLFFHILFYYKKIKGKLNIINIS